MVRLERLAVLSVASRVGHVRRDVASRISTDARVGVGGFKVRYAIGHATKTESLRLRCVLGAPGGPVDLDRHSRRRCARFEQFERSVLAHVGEQPRALADDHGICEQGDLVDKLVIE